MATFSLLYKDRYSINDKIDVMIPTVGEILRDEDSYYRLVTLITAMPIDLMVQLADAKIDYTSINEFDLFMLLFPGLREEDTSLIFGDLDLKKFKPRINEQNGLPLLYDEESDIKIDRAIHAYIAEALRKIHHLEKNRRKPANTEAQEYLLKRAREKQKRRMNRREDSQLEALIVAMVNAEQYKYDFETTKELSIYQFNESVRQIIKKVDYDNRMHGIYAGTISAKEFSREDLNWLTHK